MLSTDPSPCCLSVWGRMVNRDRCPSGCCAARSFSERSTASASRVEMICEGFLPLTKTHGKPSGLTSKENHADCLGSALP